MTLRSPSSPSSPSCSRARAQRALLRLRAALLGGAVATVVALGVVAAQDQIFPPPVAVDDVVTPVDRAMAAHDCSTTGFAPGVIPASALVRTPAGRLRQVTFDRGWAVHEGTAPGLLIAVCHDPLR